MGRQGTRRRDRRAKSQESPDSPRKPVKTASFSFPVVHPHYQDLVQPSVYKSGVMRAIDPPPPEVPLDEPNVRTVLKIVTAMGKDIESLTSDVRDLKNGRAYTICMYNPDAKIEYAKLRKEIKRSHKKGKEVKVGKMKLVLKYGWIPSLISLLLKSMYDAYWPF